MDKIFSKYKLNAFYPGWIFGSTGIALLLVLPIIAVVWVALTGTTTEWEHIAETLLVHYVGSTIILALGVFILASVLGILTALLVVFVDFPGKKFFEWALILPLSIPAYLMAFSYSEMCGYEGWISKVVGRIDLMNLKGAIFIFGFSLYPYIYLPLKTFFRNEGFRLIEAGASLGKSPMQSFFKLILPISFSVILGGGFLCIMEVFNDFGVVKYFGVPTLTVGIFRAWTGFADITSALRLSTILMLVVFALLLTRRFANSNFSSKTVVRSLGNSRGSRSLSFLAFATCFVLLFFSFLLPFFQMISGVVATYSKVMDEAFLAALVNSLKLATITSLLAVLIAILAEFALRINKNNLFGKLSAQSLMMGYSIPGAVVALGVLAPVTGFDKWMYRNIGSDSILISGTIIVLIYALVLRYVAVALSSLRSGYQTMSPNLLDASRSLGSSPFRTISKVDVPVLRNYLLSAFILVFVDVLKELPLTMILRPFNFDTLATKAFNLASDELLREASNASILIVLAGMLPIFVLNRLMKNATA